MGLPHNLGRLSPAITSDASLNIGIGVTPSGTYKLEVNGTVGLSGALTGTSATFANTTALGIAAQTTAGFYNGVAASASGSSFFTKTGSLSSSFSSGFAVDGTYAGGLSNINLRAIGTRTAGGYASAFSFILDNNGVDRTHAIFSNNGNSIFYGNVEVRSAGQLIAYRSDNTRSGSFYTDNLAVHLTSSNDPIRISSADRTEFYNGGVERARIPTNGGVQSTPAVGSNAFIAGVSGTAIAYLSSLASTSDFSGYWLVAGNFAGSISHPTNTSTNYNTSSDYRLKENIKPLSNGLESILKLNPITGNYINDETKMNMPMFLAHEVKEVVPVAVTGEKDAMKIDKITGKEIMDIQQLDASKLIPHMVKAIQELKAEIDILKNN